MNAPVAGVAFDLDGTLVDLEALHHEAWLAAARQAGVHLTRDQALQRLPHFVGGPDPQVAAEIAALAPAAGPAVPPAQTLAAKQRCFDDLAASVEEIAPRAGVGAVLDRLRALEVPIAVGTATERGVALAVLRRAGLLALFGEARVVAARDVPRLKPAPDVYLATAQLLGVPPQRQLVFEDSVTGALAARDAGSRVVAVPTVHDPDYLRRFEAAGAVAVVQDWRAPGLLPLLDRLTAAPDEPPAGRATGPQGRDDHPHGAEETPGAAYVRA
ncbi:HAD family hydrolase [Actinacidiphila bryophytorum]|uniref:Haloacid dehalogenase superfamily, subfamily IA, variant 3 with third motif having DD or ED n=1 Tax=Actinacidiphila bryophytorum TaxID=1436133 RepID=A0A9W4MGB8_9ACTN|nr:HAD family phosphatase [Actinacidiphila bryophytorum]MBM9439361.1 HAD family phosphatase [Actinacidiphila bryophytorum]MBN6546307.1 HAD family phosphatase [Actinacidiphila bryophytorum]CAG7638459.1 Haloacid dehalogenase superfamily, subfamily IA, variant 3 with third motif having DD or ED [Actinacidiphila bryophytorum]